MKLDAYTVGQTGLIHIGDARQLLQILPAESVHLVVTSPPYHDRKTYGNTPDAADLGRPQPYDQYLEEMTDIWRFCHRALTPGGKLAFISANMKERQAKPPRLAPLHHDLVAAAEAAGFTYHDEALWLKKSSYTGSPEGRPLFGSYPLPGNPKFLNQLWEHIAVMAKSGKRPRRYDAAQKELSKIGWEQWREWTNGVWRIESVADPDHPATLRPEVPQRLIRLYTFVGETVLDPFAGIGTAVIAAEACGRQGIGIELHETYTAVAHRRGEYLQQLPLDGVLLPHATHPPAEQDALPL